MTSFKGRRRVWRSARSTYTTVLIVLAFAVPVVPLAGEAQQFATVARVGYLTVAVDDRLRRAFSEGLRDLGWIEGQTIVVEERSADGKLERLADLAADLARLNVDVIVAAGSVAVIRAAKQATSTIPIVMALGIDPVGQGFISSIRRPGGNITGVTWDSDPPIYGKYPELLKEMIPRLTRVGALRDPGEPYVYRKAVEDTAMRLGLTIRHAEVRSPGDLEGAFVAITGWGAQALIIYGSPVFYRHLAQIVTLAAKHRLPAISVWREAVAMNLLMSYAVDRADLYRRAAYYVARILRGANPGDLPVEQPRKFEFVINARTANALGVTIPPSILLRADQVIE